jgi:hypothetical protein
VRPGIGIIPGAERTGGIPRPPSRGSGSIDNGGTIDGVDGGGATGGTTTGLGSGTRGTGVFIIPVALVPMELGGAGGNKLGVGANDGAGAASGGVGGEGRGTLNGGGATGVE